MNKPTKKDDITPEYLGRKFEIMRDVKQHGHLRRKAGGRNRGNQSFVGTTKLMSDNHYHVMVQITLEPTLTKRRNQVDLREEEIVWRMKTGDWPIPGSVAHLDGETLNNSFANLYIDPCFGEQQNLFDDLVEKAETEIAIDDELKTTLLAGFMYAVWTNDRPEREGSSLLAHKAVTVAKHFVENNGRA